MTNGDDGLFIPVGADVTWTYTVTNEGNVALSNVTVTDSEAGVTPAAVVQGACPIPIPGKNVGDLNGDGDFEPNETWVYRATGTATAGPIREHWHGNCRLHRRRRRARTAVRHRPEPLLRGRSERVHRQDHQGLRSASSATACS